MKLPATILTLVACAALADEVVETKTITTTGTLSEYEPGVTFVVKEKSGPTKYRYAKKVEYVTKKGAVLTPEQVKTRIKVGIPITVDYDNDGDVRVVRRVVVEEDKD